MAGTPLHVWLAAGALVYFALTAYVLSQGGRIGGRGWLMDPAVPFIVFLGFLVACSWASDWAMRGLDALRHGTPAVISGTMLVLVLAAAIRMIAPGGARSWWIRLPFLLVSVYAAAAFAMPLVTGHALWAGIPRSLQGTWIGFYVVLPIAFARELGASIARLAIFPYLRWMFVFGFGCWVAFNLGSL